MFNQFLNQLLSVIPIGVVMLIAFLVMRAMFGYHVRLHGYSYAGAMVAGNTAPAIRFAGIFFGSTLAFWGVLAPTGLGIVNDLIKISQCLFLVMAFMVITGYINDKLILWKIDNLEAIFKDGNLSVAFIEFGSFVSTGLIFSASQSGESTFVSNVLWFFGGQVLLAFSVIAFALARKGLDGISEMHGQVAVDNRSYALSLAGFIISIGVVLHVVVRNAEKPGAAIASLLVWLAVTFILQFMMNRLMIQGRNMKHMIANGERPNPGVGALQGIMFLVSALVITVLN